MKFAFILVALSLAWCAGFVFFCMGISAGLSGFTRGAFHFFLAATPFAAVAALALKVFGKEASIPLYLLLAIVLGGGAWSWLEDRQTQSELRQADQRFERRELEDFVTVEVPASFDWEKRQRLANFYYLNPTEGHFTYQFQRRFTNDQLEITFFDEKPNKVPRETESSYSSETAGNFYLITLNREFPEAQSILERIGKSIRFTKSLKEAREEQKAVFYRDNPDKK